jgi:hypothetical protein
MKRSKNKGIEDMEAKLASWKSGTHLPHGKAFLSHFICETFAVTKGRDSTLSISVVCRNFEQCVSRQERNVLNYWLDKNLKLIKLPEITNALKNAPGVTSHLVGKNGFLTAIVGNFYFRHMTPSTISERALSNAVQYVIGLHEAKLIAKIASTQTRVNRRKFANEKIKLEEEIEGLKKAALILDEGLDQSVDWYHTLMRKNNTYPLKLLHMVPKMYHAFILEELPRPSDLTLFVTCFGVGTDNAQNQLYEMAAVVHTQSGLVVGELVVSLGVIEGTGNHFKGQLNTFLDAIGTRFSTTSFTFYEIKNPSIGTLMADDCIGPDYRVSEFSGTLKGFCNTEGACAYHQFSRNQDRPFCALLRLRSKLRYNQTGQLYGDVANEAKRPAQEVPDRRSFPLPSGRYLISNSIVTNNACFVYEEHSFKMKGAPSHTFLGAGTFGSVYRCTFEGTPTAVLSSESKLCVKFFNPQTTKAKEQARHSGAVYEECLIHCLLSFLDRTRVQQTLRALGLHRDILGVIQCFGFDMNNVTVVTSSSTSTERPVPYLVMAAADSSLGARIQSQTHMCAGVARAVNDGMAVALHKMHTHLKRIHRDLHRGNVLLSGEGDATTAFVCDFGRHSEIGGKKQSTRYNVDANRKKHMTYAPEINARNYVGPHTDIYGYVLLVLGCVLGEEEWRRAATIGTLPTCYYYPALQLALSVKFDNRVMSKLVDCHTQLGQLINEVYSGSRVDNSRERGWGKECTGDPSSKVGDNGSGYNAGLGRGRTVASRWSGRASSGRGDSSQAAGYPSGVSDSRDRGCSTIGYNRSGYNAAGGGGGRTVASSQSRSATVNSGWHNNGGNQYNEGACGTVFITSSQAVGYASGVGDSRNRWWGTNGDNSSGYNAAGLGRGRTVASSQSRSATVNSGWHNNGGNQYNEGACETGFITSVVSATSATRGLSTNKTVVAHITNSLQYQNVGELYVSWLNAKESLTTKHDGKNFPVPFAWGTYTDMDGNFKCLIDPPHYCATADNIGDHGISHMSKCSFAKKLKKSSNGVISVQSGGTYQFKSCRYVSWHWVRHDLLEDHEKVCLNNSCWNGLSSALTSVRLGREFPKSTGNPF